MSSPLTFPRACGLYPFWTTGGTGKTYVCSRCVFKGKLATPFSLSGHLIKRVCWSLFRSRREKNNGADADVEDNADDGEEEEDGDEEEIAVAVDIGTDAASSHISVDSRVEGDPGGEGSDSSGEGCGARDSFSSFSSSRSSPSSVHKAKKPAPALAPMPAAGGVAGKRGKTGKIAPW